MANNTVAEIAVSRSAVTGAIFWAPEGTALPTDATTVLAGAYQNLGYVGADGITPARDVTTDPVTDMNGDEILQLQTGFSKAYSAPMLQTRNEYLNNAIFGDENVTVTPADATRGKRLTVLDKGVVSPRGVMVIELGDGGTGKERRVCPVARIITAEEGALVGTAVQTFTLTYSLSKDSSGVYDYKYYDDGVPTA